MMNLKVFDNLEQAISFFHGLGDALEPEMAKSLNAAARGIKTDVTKRLASQRGISRDELKGWDFRYARPGDLESQAVVSGQRLGLEKFAPNPSTVMHGRTSGGVKVDLMGKSVQFRHAFMGLKKDQKGGLKVFERDRKHLSVASIPEHASPEAVRVRRKRLRPAPRDYYGNSEFISPSDWNYKLHRLTAVSVPQMADDDDVVEVVIQNLGGRLLKQFDHLVGRLIEDLNV